MTRIPHITVCICTFKRPQSLEQLLFALETQRTDDLFSFSAVVVDNDLAESASEIVIRARRETRYRIEYYVEPRQNIALARNRAILNASGDFIAMIDDDEAPISEWLYFLFSTLCSSKVDGVLGPVRPAFPPEAPHWLQRSGLCERSSHPTGTLLADTELRTGNALLHHRVFNNGKNLFEEQFGRTGGEDSEFFGMRIREGFIFSWCEEAPVYEYVLPERCFLSFYLRRFLRIGGLTGEKMREGSVPLWGNFTKSMCIAIIYTFIIPVLAFCGMHLLARHLVKYVYHISRVLGALGLVLIRER